MHGIHIIKDTDLILPIAGIKGLDKSPHPQTASTYAEHAQMTKSAAQIPSHFRRPLPKIVPTGQLMKPQICALHKIVKAPLRLLTQILRNYLGLKLNLDHLKSSTVFQENQSAIIKTQSTLPAPLDLKVKLTAIAPFVWSCMQFLTHPKNFCI